VHEPLTGTLLTFGVKRSAHECSRCQDLGSTIGGEENPATEVGKQPPVQSSVLGVQKTVSPSRAEIGVAFLDRIAGFTDFTRFKSCHPVIPLSIFSKIEQVKDPKAC
jgi:hypothetical protein